MLEKIQKRDDVLIQKVAKLHRPFLNKLMRFLTFLGDQGKIWLLIIALEVWKTQSLYVFVSMFVSVLFAFILSEVIIKRIVGRVRPCHKIDEEDLILKKIPKYYSFPSSHSATSFAMLTMCIIHCDFLTVLVVFVLAAGISFSRFYLQAHYFTDVMCGIAIGIIFPLIMAKIIYIIFSAYAPEMVK
ncbi:MAG: phosphatase PAP2 family protein [Clostridia bacterium]|nr:phosphatase PAP2 family protein [Clostridia bacterium]